MVKFVFFVVIVTVVSSSIVWELVVSIVIVSLVLDLILYILPDIPTDVGNVNVNALKQTSVLSVNNAGNWNS